MTNIVSTIATMRKRYYQMNKSVPQSIKIGENRLDDLKMYLDDLAVYSNHELYNSEEFGYVYGMRFLKHENPSGLEVR